jgi:hypothetical protein
VLSLNIFAVVIPLSVLLIYPLLLSGVFQYNEKTRGGMAPRPFEMLIDSRRHFRPVLKGFIIESFLVGLTIIPAGAAVFYILTLEGFGGIVPLITGYAILFGAFTVIGFLQFYSIGIVRHNIDPAESVRYSIDIVRENLMAVAVFSLLRVAVPGAVSVVLFTLGGFALQTAPTGGTALAPVVLISSLVFAAAFHYTYHSEFYRLIAPDGNEAE